MRRGTERRALSEGLAEDKSRLPIGMNAGGLGWDRLRLVLKSGPLWQGKSDLLACSASGLRWAGLGGEQADYSGRKNVALLVGDGGR